MRNFAHRETCRVSRAGYRTNRSNPKQNCRRAQPTSKEAAAARRHRNHTAPNKHQRKQPQRGDMAITLRPTSTKGSSRSAATWQSHPAQQAPKEAAAARRHGNHAAPNKHQRKQPQLRPLKLVQFPNGRRVAQARHRGIQFKVTFKDAQLSREPLIRPPSKQRRRSPG